MIQRLNRSAWLVAVLMSFGLGVGHFACVQATSPRAKAIPAGNIVTLRENVGQNVTVRGRIDRTGASQSGIQFLNFAHSELTAVCYPEHVGRFTDGKPVDLYRGQNVELMGKVELYRNKLQIRLTDPKQITILKESDYPAAKGVKLKKIGTDVWLSPGGLRYQGRDPAGLTRVEHIERHVKDQPERAGPHGVFDGGSEVAFAVIDEAWQRAEQLKLRADREGSRSSYTVPMPRRIGYLGGRTGAARGKPALDRVFIVFETGTKNIITAFPK